jgi:LmbE family N-acetylglucosaminyl deacetylase
VTAVATVVSFHAHPDDEALLTGGTLAMLSAQGHRVVIVVACDGIMGAATSGDGGARRSRLGELKDSASVLGVAKVVHLGYADSGHGPVLFPDPPDRQRFVRAEVEEAASRLAGVLRDERADVLISYHLSGGNGHRDHVRVHEVGVRAAELAGTARVLEATSPREWLARMVRILRPLRLIVRFEMSAIQAGPPRSAITHRLNVRAYARQKQAALAAHKSQHGIGRAGRAVWILVRLPVPVFGVLLGTEWFIDTGVTRDDGQGFAGRLLDDVGPRRAEDR